MLNFTMSLLNRLNQTVSAIFILYCCFPRDHSFSIFCCNSALDYSFVVQTYINVKWNGKMWSLGIINHKTITWKLRTQFDWVCTWVKKWKKCNNRLDRLFQHLKCWNQWITFFSNILIFFEKTFHLKNTLKSMLINVLTGIYLYLIINLK
jgi:hypothetical protein